MATQPEPAERSSSRWSMGRWWGRSRNLPSEVYASWAESHHLIGNDPVPRILAWARTPEGCCIGSTSQLSYWSTERWTHIGWHEIERGGWNVETSRLRWTLYDGRQGFVELSEAGRLPELFRERVAASIVLEKLVPVGGGRGMTIAGRRDLGRPDQPVVWHTTLQRGLSWDDKEVEAIADAALEQVRSEYGGS